MLLYLRNKNSEDFIDPLLGIVIPKKVVDNEGIFTIDQNDLNGLLRENDSSSSNLYKILTTGVSGALTYGVELYVSDDGSAGKDKNDIGSEAGALAADQAKMAYDKIRGLIAQDVYYDSSSTTNLTGSKNVASALNELDNIVTGLTSLTNTIQWRPAVQVMTYDTQFSGTSDILVSSLSFPLSDDDGAQTVSPSDLSDGKYLIYNDPVIANQKIWKVVGTSLVLQTGDDGLNEGYSYIVEKDLPAVDILEKQAIYTYTNADGLIKLSDLSWELPKTYGMKSFADEAAFLADKAAGTNDYHLDEPVYISDVRRFVIVKTLSTGVAQGTDWAFLGDSGMEMAGSLELNLNNVKVVDGKSFVLPLTTTTPEIGSTKFNTTIGMICTYDGTDWLSANRQNVIYSASKTDGEYLSMGNKSSGTSGYLALRNMKIKAIGIKIGNGNKTKDFEIRIDGVIAGVVLSVGPSGALIDDTLDLDLASGKTLQVFSSSTGAPAKNVVVNVELAYVG